MLVHCLWEEYMYMLWLYKEAQLSQSIKKATTRDDYHYNYHIIIIISVSIFLSISQELQGKCKPLLFEAQQQSITNYIPPVECIFYSLPGFWIRCFSCLLLSLSLSLSISLSLSLSVLVYFQVFPRNYEESANPCCLKHSNRAKQTIYLLLNAYSILCLVFGLDAFLVMGK